MISWSRKHTWITGLAILVLTNAVALSGVAYNRSGEPGRTLVLTERELSLPYSTGFGRENSGISLAVKWRFLPSVNNEYGYANRWSAVEWLDEGKLDGLGFEAKAAVLAPESRFRFNRNPSRLVWLVLEYNGDAYQEMRNRVEAFSYKKQELASLNPGNEEIKKLADRAKERWDEEQNIVSRLFVVDAGLDLNTLQNKYSDKTRYILQRGEVRASVRKNENEQWIVQGYIQGLAVETVNVPLAFREVFETLLDGNSRDNEDTPGFIVKLAYGKRQEPWIISAE